MQFVEVTNQNVDSVVREGKTFLYFTADFSPFALAMKPVYEKFCEIAKDYDVKIAYIYITNNISLGDRFQIKDLPTMLVFNDGMKVDECPGIVPVTRYENMLKFF